MNNSTGSTILVLFALSALLVAERVAATDRYAATNDADTPGPSEPGATTVTPAAVTSRPCMTMPSVMAPRAPQPSPAQKNFSFSVAFFLGGATMLCGEMIGRGQFSQVPARCGRVPEQLQTNNRGVRQHEAYAQYVGGVGDRGCSRSG